MAPEKFPMYYAGGVRYHKPDDADDSEHHKFSHWAVRIGGDWYPAQYHGEADDGMVLLSVVYQFNTRSYCAVGYNQFGIIDTSGNGFRWTTAREVQGE